MPPKYVTRPTTDWWPNWSTAPLDYNDTFSHNLPLSSTIPYPGNNSPLNRLEAKTRYERRKERALKRKKPRFSKRRHKLSK